MKKIVYIIFVALLAAVAGPVCGQSQHTLGNIPEGWTVTAGGDTVPVVNGTATITDGATVVLTPTNPAFVKSVTLTDAPAPAPGCRRITLDTVQHHFVAQDCDTLTGTLDANNHPVKISIADGATVILDGVTINGTNNQDYNWAGITCLGDATLILKDGTTDTVKGFYDEYPGIYVPVGSTLTIQGGALGTGKLIASSNGLGAGIGGGSGKSCGNINIQGGDIKAMGGSNAAGIGSGYNASCDTITITGGTIEATGGSTAAGIGSGYHHASCSAITISGGNITATGGSDAAGIGSGYGSSCDTIAISGGNVIATGGSGAAGIGSAWSTSVEESSCGNITITGGTVNATGGDNAAGIGSGYDSDSDQGGSASCGNITITGGTVNATSGTRASGIGSGKGSSCGAITITSDVTRVTATSDAVVSIGYGNGDPENSSCGTITFGTQQMYNGTAWTTTPTSGQTYGGLKFIISTDPNIDFVHTWELTPASAPAPSCRRVDLSQITADSVMQDCDTLTGTLAANVKISIAAGATVTLDSVTINGTTDEQYTWAGITCLGDATIILKDGTTNTVKGFYEDYPGIYVPESSTLTIQGGALGTGKLIASSNGFGAGIGAGFDSLPCGNIRIEGGIIEATGGDSAAGIGNGYDASCGAITITGGNVNATGGSTAAGIGSGYEASCGAITISGGNITATGGSTAAGIGSGIGSSCETITITGGNVNATGGESAAGIGSGYEASCGAITITSGVTSVTATKGEGAPNSIGAGDGGSCGTVTIGGTVYYQDNAYVGTGSTYLTQSPLVYPTPAPTGAINGKFTINASGDQVYFSQGNLKYNGSNSWNFHTNQYDIVRTTDGYMLSYPMDLFCWGNVADPAYAGSSYVNGDIDLSVSGGTDWGANTIYSGSTATTGWRTLTSAEWTYLFNTRAASTIGSTSNARFAKAYLFGTTHGIIIFPDSYTHPDGVDVPTGINAEGYTSWNANNYNATDWGKMETAGAVFLPAAGKRYGEYVDYVSASHSVGGYWSSTHGDDVYTDDPVNPISHQALHFLFEDGSLYPGSGTESRSLGFSVRLVKDVQ